MWLVVKIINDISFLGRFAQNQTKSYLKSFNSFIDVSFMIDDGF